MVRATLWGVCIWVLIVGVAGTKEDPHDRAVRLVGQMTLEEKMGFLQGSSA